MTFFTKRNLVMAEARLPAETISLILLKLRIDFTFFVDLIIRIESEQLNSYTKVTIFPLSEVSQILPSFILTYPFPRDEGP